MEPLSKVQQELFDWLVEYIERYQHAPSIRQMMQGMKLKSPAPVQSRLDHLRKKGYVDWEVGQARTLRIVHPSFDQADTASIPILGEIAAGGLIEPFTEALDSLALSSQQWPSQSYALRVNGDSMIDAHITDGDIVILRPVTEPKQIKNGTIVAARVEGEGTTLKRFFHQRGKVVLEAANDNYQPMNLPATQVEIQGSLVGIWRSYL
ncbi:MAG: repressor LexA [Acaryochloridaceae cyanobacterium SU_2_1]|nr:repressor LexA [Acaryochloridaceae cyanobacterium SU_2_1]